MGDSFYEGLDDDEESEEADVDPKPVAKVEKAFAALPECLELLTPYSFEQAINVTLDWKVGLVFEKKRAKTKTAVCNKPSCGGSRPRFAPAYYVAKEKLIAPKLDICFYHDPQDAKSMRTI